MNDITFAEAKQILKDEYIRVGLTLTDEHIDQLFFSYKSVKIKIDKEDITAFQTLNNNRSQYEVKPVECSIVSKNYREHIIEYLHPLRRFMYLPSKQIFFGKASSANTYAEISYASNVFINYFRFNEQFIDLFLDRITSFRMRNKDIESISEVFRPLTIKIYNINESSLKSALSKSHDLIDSCIFTLSSLKEQPFKLVDTWPSARRGMRSSKNFEFGETIKGDQLPLPKIKVKDVLVRFHQQATSTDIPSLRYLAFYQILEYFYLSVSDENLYNKLKHRINDLKFKTTPSHLDNIIQDVYSHKRENDETGMLKSVLIKYLDEGDLIKFIEAYETHLGKKIYTEKREIFGNQIEVKLTSDHLFGNIAKTIKAIRNALVHSSDRHERNERYIPYSEEGTALLEQELPLIKYIADKVIIASSEEI